MIEFDQQQAIYLQVADFMADQILNRTWPESERIPSVREVAAQLQVNPNTVMRSFTILQDNELIINRRGVGYFVAESGHASALKWKREDFISQSLPRLFHQATVLGVTPKELQSLYQQYLQDNKETNN